jgi:flavin-dependent thymidylate synthase
MPEPGKEIVKWGDEAMYEAAPIRRGEGEIHVTPKVFLLSATPDPLGALAAGFRMYGGKPTYSLADITDDERLWAWEESLKTHLKAPWEFIDFHFFIEGVTRAWTHQAVRQRTAVYAQESLRFAVKEGFASEVAYPPAVLNNDLAKNFWDQTVKEIERAYSALVNMGIPAEDARGLLPHCTTTRMNYKTNLRGLVEHAGNRLCTQAQFEWRAVFISIVKAIREHSTDIGQHVANRRLVDNWQWRIISKPIKQTFTPVCYHVGHCVFMGTLDRGCTIRERVNEGRFDEIEPMEWLADPMAGITNAENEGPGT